MNVLLIGGGGREHAMAWKLLQSGRVGDLVCAPGNAGIAQICECVDVSAGDIDGLIELVKFRKIDFVIAGPEQPLSLGITDALAAIDVPCFGPTKAAAQLESSKAFMKDFCKRNHIPTAGYEVFTEIAPAKAFLKTLSPPYVIKTDGLAAGKGVAIPESLEEAEAELEAYFSGKFGEAGKRLIIEEFMSGDEISFFALCDGNTAIPFGSAQDHKRAFDGDQGPNTGGMGAYAPAPVFDAKTQERVMDDIVLPTLAGMKAEGYPFTGVLFAGLMLTKDGPRLIEYNVRFGDPECQVIMRMLESDLFSVFEAATSGKLNSLPPVKWDMRPVVNVVMCANGYPGRYAKGTPIHISKDFDARPGVTLFHAGTSEKDGQILAAGGRVLNITARADDLQSAVTAAYDAIDNGIDWQDGFVRRDIAGRAL